MTASSPKVPAGKRRWRPPITALDEPHGDRRLQHAADHRHDTQDVCSNEPLDLKFAAFGWFVQSVDGHDLNALVTKRSASPSTSGRPNAIIARTIKGRGVSFMEDVGKWHHGVPSDESTRALFSEIDTAIATLGALE